MVCLLEKRSLQGKGWQWRLSVLDSAHSNPEAISCRTTQGQQVLNATEPESTENSHTVLAPAPRMVAPSPEGSQMLDACLSNMFYQQNLFCLFVCSYSEPPCVWWGGWRILKVAFAGRVCFLAKLPSSCFAEGETCPAEDRAESNQAISRDFYFKRSSECRERAKGWGH